MNRFCIYVVKSLKSPQCNLAPCLSFYPKTPDVGQSSQTFGNGLLYQFQIDWIK